MPDPNKLTSYSRFSGCGAKLGPALLDKALCGLEQVKYPHVLADFTGSEDAGVIRLGKDSALIQTLDFFPPVSDDPGIFGEIAAANALSDIYAMGGRPVSAVNILCYPEEDLPLDYLRRIMEGALVKLAEAEVPLLGGHSVMDRELKFGFCVNGLIHPDKILRNNTPREGDLLVLSKALGSGTINTALRANIASREAVQASEDSMRRLNKDCARLLLEVDVSACTDITGFGLAGHAAEMVSGSTMDLHIQLKQIPILPDALDYLAMGLVPEGTFRNKAFRGHMLENPAAASPEMMDLLFDPQTSGGLFVALREKDACHLVQRLRDQGDNAAMVGWVGKGKERIILDA